MELNKPEQIFQKGVSPSMLKAWLLCRRKWYNHYVRGLERDESPQLIFGKALHTFLARYYFPGAMKPDIQAGIEQFKADFPESLDCKNRSQALGLAIITAYVKQYPLESERFKVLSVDSGDKDKGLQVALPNCKYPLYVIPDMIIQQYDATWVLEHKTSTVVDVNFFEPFKNDYQVYAQLYAIQQLRQCVPGGIVIDAISCAKNPSQRFIRRDLTFCANQIEYHIREYEKVANEMIEFVEKNWQDVNKFTMSASGNACWSYFTKCPYMEACEFNDNENFLAQLKRKEVVNELPNT